MVVQPEAEPCPSCLLQTEAKFVMLFALGLSAIYVFFSCPLQAEVNSRSYLSHLGQVQELSSPLAEANLSLLTVKQGNEGHQPQLVIVSRLEKTWKELGHCLSDVRLNPLVLAGKIVFSMITIIIFGINQYRTRRLCADRAIV